MRPSRAPRPARLRGDRGAAAVEFALVSFLLFSLLLGTIGFGFVLFAQQSALHAAREGARLAAVGVNGTCTAFQNVVAARGKGANVSASAVKLAYTDTNGNGAHDAGDTVTVSIPYTVNIGFLGFIGFSSFNGTQTGIARAETVGTVTACP
jgi:Flp pilus assembly protein TadG